MASDGDVMLSYKHHCKLIYSRGRQLAAREPLRN